MSDFKLCFLVFPMEMSQICTTELHEIFQGKKSHGDISGQLTKEERLEKDMKEHEKIIDLEYFAQVTFTQPQHIGASTSAATPPQ